MRTIMKRVLAIVLCCSLMVGSFPLNAFAVEPIIGSAAASVATGSSGESDNDYLFIATDRHANTSIIGNIINNMESKIGENELDYLALGGDMVGQGKEHPSYSSSTVLREVTGATSSLSAANVDIVAGIHDMNVTDDAGIVLPYESGGAQIYEGDRYYVYGVPESCISGAVSGIDPSTEANAFVSWANGSDIDKSKVIIVVSHYPLHQRRNDNGGAVYWAEALNKVAAGDDTTIDRDVAFFWGHNHTEESNADTAVYHIEPNGSISVQGGSSNQTIYFTYANAGYLNAKSSATLVTITDTTITFDKYVNSSVSTTKNVTRVVPAVTLSSIAVTAPTKTTYTVGEALDTTGMVVKATYSDGTTADVTGYTLSEVNMTTVGTKTVTVNYEGLTATFDITVEEAVTLESIAVSGTAEYRAGDALALKVTATYSNGTTADVTADATLTGYDMATVGTQTVTATYKDKTATFDITVKEAKEVASIAITTLPIKYVYTVGDTEVDPVGMVVTATYTDGTTEEVTNYTLSEVDMTTVGVKTVTVSYGGKTAEFTVSIEEVIIEQTFTPDYSVDITATARNATAEITASEKLTDVTKYVVDGYYSAFDIALEGQRAGTDVTITFYVPDEFDSENLGVYYIDENGNYVEVDYDLVYDDAYAGYTAVVKNAALGTYVYGTINYDDEIPNGASLEKLKITPPEKVDYFPETETADDGNLYIDITGMVVKAVYTDDAGNEYKRTLVWNEFDDTIDGYALKFDSSAFKTDGAKTINVSYGEAKGEFIVHIWLDEFKDEDTGVTVKVGEDEYGVTGVSVDESKNENIENAIRHRISLTNYKAYDIKMTFTDGYEANEAVKTVTLPIPDGVTNPVVYYISDNGNVVNNMDATDNGDGTVTFETTHFSIYAIGDANLDLPENETASKETEITTTIPKTVYVLTSSILAGNSYLIVNSNSASNTTRYALANNNGSVAATGVTIKSGNIDSDNANETYIELDDATDELWTTSAAIGSSTNSTLKNGDYYLYASSSGDLDLEDSTGNYTNWRLNNNQMYRYRRNYTSYYLRYNSGWTTTSSSSSASNIYFYVPTEIEVEATTTASTEYSIYNEDVTVVLPGNSTVTHTLDTELTYKVDGETASVTDVSQTATYETKYVDVNNTEVNGDPKGIISKIENGVITFSGVYGKALVKVSYNSDNGTVTDYFYVETISVPDEDYTIDLTDGAPNFISITEPIQVKNVKAGMQGSVWAIVKAGDYQLGTLGSALKWAVSDTSIATINTTTGVITFTGEEGTVDITVYYTCPGGRVITDKVTYSVTKGDYTVPEDGTDDFPFYPNRGAIRFDKHATAVGSFSKTGIVNVELSMTGVPYSRGTDVVLMLDMTGSMSVNGISASLDAASAFVDKIVKNDDGSFNNNRIAVYFFNSSGINTVCDLQSFLNADGTANTTAYDAVKKVLNKATYASGDSYDYDSIQESGGTPFDTAAKKCYDVLNDAKDDESNYDRKQFCVFMSDGGPTSYRATYNNTNGYLDITNSGSDTTAITTYFSGYNSSTSSSWNFTLPSEYYTDLMKLDGVTVYTVGLLLQNKPGNPSPYSSMSASTYDSTTDSLTSIGSHYYFTSRVLKQMASDESKYVDIFSVANSANAVKKFEDIAMSIREAATDVQVTDKIADDFTMVFEAPNPTVLAELPEGQEFYIEVKDYTLKPVYDTTDTTKIVDYQRDTAKSLMKLYLGKNGTTYYAASDANGTAYASPVFNKVAKGTMYYWTTAVNTSSGVNVTVDGTTYYFVEDGMSNTDENYDADVWYNMASGAYAFGNITTTDIIDDDTKEVTGQNTECNDLIIATPYFVYNASTRILVWTAEKLSTTELALSYFLYLDESGGYSGAANETDPGTYETNDYAYLNYTNFQNKECQQEMPVPQITWNGAQVTYVFYLVNEAGQPVNRAGLVVPFSEAVYVTDTYTYSVVWNDLERVASLEASYLAEDLVPDVYDLYDEDATYSIHVFEDEEGQDLNNHFVIGGSADVDTTYVFNVKSDSTKYKEPDTYAASTTYKCKEYVEGGEYTDDKGAYNIVTKTDATAVETGFDFSNTTVAFAVVWRPELEADTVVIDYGLDVVINVTGNDAMAAGVVGVRTDKPKVNDEEVVINSGTYDASDVKSVDVYIDTDKDNTKDLKIGTASVENLSSVRFSLDKTNGMQFKEPAVFYYETDVNYYTYPVVNGEKVETLNTTSMYSSVTVIPATTIYYEDDFVQFSSYTNGVEDTPTKWATTATALDRTQDQDVPGPNKLLAKLDADNVYGYDSAYEFMTTHSLRSAAKITVDKSCYGMAEFTFYGTGFDVIAVTSNQTGTITVKVFDAAGNRVKSKIVDTYYGMEEDGTIFENDPDTIYQVPVMKISGLTYGKYTVKITAAYNSSLDHTGTSTGVGSTDYDLYLDAIRIYDPAGTTYGDGSAATDIDGVIQDAYIADGEGWPQYQELRNNVIAAEGVTITDDGTVTFPANTNLDSGVIFIDCNDENISIVDYVSYGPNNELYLDNGQAVAFNVNITENTADVQLGIKVANGDPVVYTINNEERTVSSTTDMYYSIKEFATQNNTNTVTIKNVSGGILSLTNIKTTYEAASSTSEVLLLCMDEESAGVALMMLRPETVVEPEEDVTDDPVTDDTITDTPEDDNVTDTPETDDPVTDDSTSQVIDTVKNIVNKVVNAIGGLFNKWFR